MKFSMFSTLLGERINRLRLICRMCREYAKLIKNNHKPSFRVIKKSVGLPPKKKKILKREGEGRGREIILVIL
ncbi:MAG: hypothetical protein K2K64_12575 [Muribaculaceae bacterium]|nr:hypothetical protein [Muribaculaceae bacterium]